MKRMIAAAFMFLFLLSVTACDKAPSKESTPLNAESKAATEITAQTNAEVYQLLDFDDEQEAEFAGRGLIFAPDSLVIQAENGMTIWSQDAYDFVRESGDAPTSANPSLWRNTQYNARYGLFEVTDGIYQVRGYDISNITFVRSENGWIIMDCGSSRYTASEALKLFREQMGDDRIVAVVISHAHVDHYGGIEGLIGAEDVADASLPLDEQIASGKDSHHRAAGLCRRGHEGKHLGWDGDEAPRDLPVRQFPAVQRAGTAFRRYRSDRRAGRHGLSRTDI